MARKHILAIALAIAYSAGAFSIGGNDRILSEFVSRNWTTADGLPANSVTSIVQAPSGYLYFGTYGGLVRFDGVEFTTITKNLNPKYDFITARTLFLDSKKNLWIGSNDEGLVEIRNDGSTKRYRTEDGIPNNSIRAICEDKDGGIWIGTAAGIAIIENCGTERERLVVPSGLEEFEEGNILVLQLYCDKSGRVWIATGKENKLITYKDKKFDIYRGISSAEDPAVTFVTQDNSGAFWFGLSPHYAVKSTESGETFFDLGFGQQTGSCIEKIYQDSGNNVWFALDCGIAIYHDGKISYLDKTNGLCDNKIVDIIEDTEGNIWLATDRGGIEKLSLSAFKTVPTGSSVNALCHGTEKGLEWIACNDGLHCYKNNEFVENEITEYCKNVRIRHVGMTKDGELLISTFEKLGQVIVDKDGGIRNFTKEDGLAGDKTRAAFKSSDGKYYIATTTGLSIIEKDGSIRSITKNDGLENDYIMCVFEDSDGRIWCGTDGGGLFTLKCKSDKYEIESKLTTNEGLSGNIVFKISEIGESIWVCTGGGLTRIKNGELFNFNASNGLDTTEVMQIIPDYTGQAWLTSNRGISSVRMEELDECADGRLSRISTRFFGKSDGLISDGTTPTACSSADNLGRIWFALIDGFAIYDPMKKTTAQHAPIIHIQEISIDNEKKEWDGETVYLSPYVKRFGIRFTGVSFVSSEQTQFSTELEGFESEYTDWTRERHVSYTNLKHGKYRFSVIAKSGNDIISEPVEFTIVKKPYIWEISWFWIALGIFTLGSASLVCLTRIKSLEKQKLLLKAEVDKKTEEIWGLLLNILPKETAEEIKRNPRKTIAEKHQNVTVLFTEIVGFTKMSDDLPPEETVNILNAIFTKFDTRATLEGIEKIKTIGDAYMAACGLRKEKDAAERMIRYARGILNDLEEFNENSKTKISIRIGINTGDLVAGVIGKTKYIYDIWGDTVNTASLMESTGTPMRIHISESTFQATNDTFEFTAPVQVETKGNGWMKTYYLA